MFKFHILPPPFFFFIIVSNSTTESKIFKEFFSNFFHIFFIPLFTKTKKNGILVYMNTLNALKEFFYRRRLKKCKLTFPLFCKIHGVTSPDRQGALAQSGPGDELQLVHVPLKKYPFNVYVYNISINRVLGYLDSRLAEKLVYLFKRGFCRDGEIEQITGGEDGKCFGCNIRINESMTFLKDTQNFSHLYGEN